MSPSGIRFAVLFGFAACSIVRVAEAAPTLLGPSSPYLSFADSPFLNVDFEYFHLKDFEDGTFDAPGVTPPPPVVSITSPGPFTDSVDHDDGIIDGSGTEGRSLYSNFGTNGFSFSFDGGALGGLPTHAGIVWTDVGQVTSGNPGFGNVTFEAFGPASESLGSIGPVLLGDGLATGGTPEDNFFGVINPGGVSRIVITTANSLDWEVDHLQYGRVPEPSALVLFALTLAKLVRCRRRR